MPDVFTKAKRSAVMARIRSRGNKATELALIQIFRRHKITGWRRHRVIKFEPGGSRRDGKEVGRRLQKDEKRKASSPRPAPPSDGGAGEGKRSRRLGRGRTAGLRKRGAVRPDFIFAVERVAVFVDGCFWHGCPKHATWPKGNRSFWRKKLIGNRDRDRRVDRALRRLRWRVVRLWEHELRDGARVIRKVNRGLTRADTNRKGPGILPRWR